MANISSISNIPKNRRCEFCHRKATLHIVFYGCDPKDKHNSCQGCFDRMYANKKIKLCSIPKWAGLRK